MRFLKWLFDVSNRHIGDIRRYEKGRIANRVFVLIILCVLVAGTLALEYWALNLLNENFFLALMAIIFLFIPCAYLTIEYCGVYSYIGFRMAIVGTIAKVAAKVSDEEIKEKQYKVFDLIIGILSLALAFGLIIAIIYLFVNQT